jgi:hypothetical protein
MRWPSWRFSEKKQTLIKLPLVFGTAGKHHEKAGGPILCVLCKGWDPRRSVSRFMVSHPSPKARRMGHPEICCTFCRGQEMSRFMPQWVGNAGGRLCGKPHTRSCLRERSRKSGYAPVPRRAGTDGMTKDRTELRFDADAICCIPHRAQQTCEVRIRQPALAEQTGFSLLYGP